MSRTLIASEGLHHGLELPDVLQRTADGMASLGYRRVAISLRGRGDGEQMVTCAVAGIGGDEAETVLGASYPWHEIESLMTEERRVSRSYLVHQSREEWVRRTGGAVVFAPIEPRGAGYWGAEDALLLPLYGSDQRIIGLISVDEPADGLLPGLDRVQILETFANQASLAVENARLYTHVQAELSERRRAEAALRDSEERYRALVEGAQQPIVTLDLTGRLLFANSQFCNLVDLPSTEIVGQSLARLEIPAIVPKIKAFIQQVVRSGQTCGIEHAIELRGNTHWFQARGHPMRNDAGEITGVVVIGMDVTEQHLLEERLNEAHKLEAIGRLAGGVAHEFNNLLTVINGYCEMLIYGEDETVCPWRGEVEEIHRAGSRAAEVTRQLLAFSRRQMLNMQIIDLNQVLAGMVRMLRHIIGEDVALAIDAAGDLGAIRADAGQLEQIIINLAANARDAMPQGGTLTLSTDNVALDATEVDDTLGIPPGRYVRLSVRDDGEGMSGPNAAAPVRAVLYHQTGGPGHRTGPGHGLWHHPATGRRHPRGKRRGRRHHL